MFPDFLGIGAQKAGTTWLHSVLSRHDEIWLPRVKELHYFDRTFPPVCRTGAPRSATIPVSHRLRIFRQIKKLGNLSALREGLRVRRWDDLVVEVKLLRGKRDDAWYASLFDLGRDRIKGDITPAYSCLGDQAIAHIHKLMPDAKIIFLLRDPIDRAWSHAKMDILQKPGQPKTLETSESEFIIHFDSDASRMRGDYLGAIDRWTRHYPSDQLFVGFFDEITLDPEGLLTRILGLLGASTSPDKLPPDLRTAVNAGRPKPIPPVLHAHLASIYRDEIRILAERYGRYPEAWLKRLEGVERVA
jgi:hypothetical protein